MGDILLCCACNAATGFPYCYAKLYVFTELLMNIPASIVRYSAPPDSSRLSVCNKRITNDPRSAIRVNLVSPVSKCSCLHLCRAVKYATPTTPHPWEPLAPQPPPTSTLCSLENLTFSVYLANILTRKQIIRGFLWRCTTSEKHSENT